MTYSGQPYATPGEALEHSGVKGMKWGVRKAVEEHNSEIARARAAHPTLKSNYKQAKKQYKVDKKEIGRKAAKKILKEHGDMYYKNLSTALDKTTQEQANQIVFNLALKTVSR